MTESQITGGTMKFIIASILCLAVTLGVAWGAEKTWPRQRYLDPECTIPEPGLSISTTPALYAKPEEALTTQEEKPKEEWHTFPDGSKIRRDVLKSMEGLEPGQVPTLPSGYQQSDWTEEQLGSILREEQEQTKILKKQAAIFEKMGEDIEKIRERMWEGR
jgi:hypothetical protein